MKFSSSFKVGLLTILALVLLFGVLLKVKGRALSSAARIEVQFKDVNGMRPGAGVQMMGLKVGQVEEVTPVVKQDENYVNVKSELEESTSKLKESAKQTEDLLKKIIKK